MGLARLRVSLAVALPSYLLALAVLAGGAGLAAGALPAAPARPGWLEVAALLGYLTVAGGLHLEFRIGAERNLHDFFEAVLLVALVVLPGPVVVLVAVVAKAASEAWRRGSFVKGCFNTVQWAAAAGAGSLVFTALRAGGPLTPRDVPALVAAFAAVVAVNSVAVAVVLMLVQPPRTVVRERWRALGRAVAVNSVVNLVFGLLFTALWLRAPAATPLMLAALVALHRASRGLVAQRVGHTRLLGLQRAGAAVIGHDDPRDGVADFLREIRVAFACDGAVLELVDSPDTTIRYQYGPGGFSSELVAAGDVLIAAERARSASLPMPSHPLQPFLERWGWRDCLVTPVVIGERTAGVLYTHDREGLEGFETGELAVLEATAVLLGEVLHRRELRSAVLSSERRWRSLVQNASDLVLVLDDRARVTYATPAAVRVLGLGEEPVGTSLYDRLVDGAAARRVVESHRPAEGASARVDLRLRAADGSECDFEAVVTNLLADPAVAGVVLNCRDVSDRVRAQRWQAGQARVLEKIACGAPLHDTLCELAIVAQEQLAGARCLVHVGSPSDATMVVAPELSPTTTGAAVALLPDAIGPAGGRRLVLTEPRGGVSSLTAATFGSPDDMASFGIVAACNGGVAHDEEAQVLQSSARLAGIAVEQARVLARLAHQAQHDPVTDLPNRVVFLDRLGVALSAAERQRAYALVLFVDLDRFKEVNDSFGHQAGDDLLRQVAQRLRHAVRPGDTVARFGGDEFTILCEGIPDESHAVEVAERIQSVLVRPFPVEGRDIYVTTSMGLALDRGGQRRAETVVENADAAMYRAKDRGGNCFEIFDQAMRARAVRRLATQSALHRAIARREFQVAYQTTVSLDTGAVVGAEALVRWLRPGTGMLMPSEFIPLAEETGLIVPIGAYVIEEAFRQAKLWRDSVGPQAPTTSVNLSARQLAHPRLVPLIAAALDRSGADPSAISLEITESALMIDLDASTAVLRELKGLGLQLLIDDFGTGYSSLSYLQRFPVDGLKVDRSFVAELDTDDGGSAIVRAVVTLAHSLGMVAIAEGVETEKQVMALRELQCEIAQGYLFSRPVPADQVVLVPPG